MLFFQMFKDNSACDVGGIWQGEMFSRCLEVSLKCSEVQQCVMKMIYEQHKTEDND